MVMVDLDDGSTMNVQGQGNLCPRIQNSTNSNKTQRTIGINLYMRKFNGSRWPQGRMMDAILAPHKLLILGNGSLPHSGNKNSQEVKLMSITFKWYAFDFVMI